MWSYSGFTTGGWIIGFMPAVMRWENGQMLEVRIPWTGQCMLNTWWCSIVCDITVIQVIVIMAGSILPWVHRLKPMNLRVRMSGVG